MKKVTLSTSFSVGRLSLSVLRKGVLVPAILGLLLGVDAQAAGTWLNTGNTSAAWSNSNNWTGGVPGNTTSGLTASADTGTFNSAVGANNYGSSGTPITIDAGRTIKGITFDTSSVGAFNIGAVSGSPSLYLSNAGAIQTTATAIASNETINAPLVLVPASATTAGAYSFTSSSTSTGILSFAGNVSAGTTTNKETLTLNGTNTGANTISGGISDGGAAQGLAISKSGAGLWVLSGSNSYSAGTAITAGTVEFTATNAMPASGTVAVSNGATLAILVSGGAGQFSTATSGAGSIGGIFAGTGGQGASVTLATGALVGIDTAATTQTYAGNITNAGVGLTKLGSGTLVLSGANSYTGNTSVAAGTLAAGATNAFSSTSTVVFGTTSTGTLSLNGYDNAVGSLSGGGAGSVVSLGGNTLTVGADGVNSSFNPSTIITDSGSGGKIVKVGGSYNAFTGTGSYSGGTTLLGGMLNFAPGGLGTGTITIGSATDPGVTLSLLGSALNSIPGSPPIDVEGTGYNRLVNTGNSNPAHFGAVALHNNDIILTTMGNNLTGVVIDGGVTGTGNIYFQGQNTSGGMGLGTALVNNNGDIINNTIAGNATNNAGSVLVSATIGSLVKNVTQNSLLSVMSLSGANTASSMGANVNVQAGTLTISGAGGAGNGAINLGNSTGAEAILSVTAAQTFGNTISVTGSGLNEITQGNVATTYNGAITIGTGATLTVLPTNSTATFTGGTSGAGALVLRNAGAAGAITFSGTQINNAGGVVVGGSGTQAVSISAAINSGGFTDNNAANTVTLSGSNGYTGATTLNAGTLALSGSISSSSALVLGGGKLNYTAAGTNTQSFNGTTINRGASSLTTTATDTVALGAISRTVGGTIDFGTTGTFTTATTTNTGGIMGGFATTGTTWAVAPASSGGTITGLASASYVNDTWAAGNNTTVMNNSAPASGSTTNSLRFNKAAASTLTLAGTNTITTGGIFVTSTVGNNAQTITGGTLVGSAGGDLVVIQNDTNATGLTIASIIADNGGATGFTKSGTGALTLSGANTYTGATTINAGAVTIGSGGALGGTNAALTMGNVSGATLNLADHSTTVGSISGGGLTNATVNGGINLGTLAATTLTTGGLGTNTTYAGVISGAGVLVKNGSGTQILTGVNTYTGGTTINHGAVQLGDGGTTGALSSTGGISLANSDASLINNHADNVTISNNITGSGAVTQLGGGYLTLSGTNSFSGGLNIKAGAVATGAGTSAGVLGTGAITIGDSANTGLSAMLNVGSVGTISNAINVVGNGADTIELSYNGTPTDNFTGNVSIANNLNLVVATLAQANVTLNLANLAGSSITSPGSSTGDLIINDTYIGNGSKVTINLGASSATSINYNGYLTNNSSGFTPTPSAPSVVNVNGTLGANILGVNQNSNGVTMILFAANTYAGPTTISNGVLDLKNALAAQNSVVAINAGTGASGTTNGLQFDSTAGAAFTIGGLSGSNNEALLNTAGSAVALTVGNNNNTGMAYSGALSGGGSLIKVGSGTQTLSGNSTYTGGTSFNAGTIAISGANNLGAASSTLNFNGGTLELTANSVTLAQNGTIATGTTAIIQVDSGASLKLNGILDPVATTGSLTKTGLGTLIFAGDNLYTGATLISAGILNYQDSMAFGQSSTITVALNATAQVQNGISGGSSGFGLGNMTISGAGAAGATGALESVSGNNNYQDQISLGANATVAVDADTFTLYNGIDTKAHLVTVTGAGNLVIDSIDPSSSGIIGTGSVTKTGAGTLTYNRDNTYTGLTTVTNGKLDLNNNTGLGNAINGNTLINGGTVTLLASDQIVNTGSVTVSSGLLDFNGNNETFTNLTVSGGTVNYGSGAVSIIDPTWSGGNNNVTGSTSFGELTVSGGNNEVFGLGANPTAGNLTVGGATDSVTGDKDLTFSGTGSPTILLDSDDTTPGTLTLHGDVTVKSSLTTGTAQILSVSGLGANPGVVDLGAATRTFTTNGNSSSGTDLLVTAQITNGGLAKAGTGTMAITADNTYGDGTTITKGALYVDNGGGATYAQPLTADPRPITPTNSTGSGTGTGFVSVGDGTAHSGTLAGGGTIAPTSGGVTIHNGGTLASGSLQTVYATSKGGNGSVNGDVTGAGGGMTINNAAALSNALTVEGGATLTFALGSTTQWDGGSGPYNFADPNTNSTYLSLTGDTTNQIFSNSATPVNINLIDLTYGSSTVALTLRDHNPYLLIQTALGDNSDFANLVTTDGTTISMGANGYVLGVSTGGPGNAYTAFNINVYDVDGHLLSSSTNFEGLKLYLYNGDLEVVPEPSTWALLLGGLAILILIQRRRNKI